MQTDMHTDQTTAGNRAGGGKTTSTLDTRGLVEGLSVDALHEAITDGVNAFDGNNLVDCADNVNAACKDVWRAFETGPARIISDLRAQLKATIKEWPTTLRKLVAHRDQQLAQAKGSLVGDLRKIAREDLDKEEKTGDVVEVTEKEETPATEASVEIAPAADTTAPTTTIPEVVSFRSPLQKIRDEVNGFRRELEDILIEFTGYIGGHIPTEYTMDAVKKIFIYFGIGYALVEAFSTFRYFAAGTTPTEGFIQTMLLILVGTALADGAGVFDKRLVTMVIAQLARRRAYPKGVDADSQPVPAQPFDLVTAILAIGSTAGFITVIIVFLRWRLNLAATDAALKGTEVIAYLVSLALAVNAGVVFAFAPAHKEEVIDRYGKAKEKLEGKQKDLEKAEKEEEQSCEAHAAACHQAASEIQSIYHQIQEITETLPEAQHLLEETNNHYNDALDAAEAADTADVADYAQALRKFAERAKSNADAALNSARRMKERADALAQAAQDAPPDTTAVSEAIKADDPVSQAKFRYQLSVRTIEAQAQKPVTEITADRTRYRGFVSFYESTHNTMLIPATDTVLAEFFNKLDLRCKKDHIEFDKKAAQRQHGAEILQKRDRACRMRLLDSVFDGTELEQFDPALEPGQVVTDFDALEQQIRDEERNRRRAEKEAASKRKLRSTDELEGTNEAKA